MGEDAEQQDPATDAAANDVEELNVADGDEIPESEEEISQASVEGDV